MFAWVLAKEADGQILKVMDTQVSFPSPGLASVTTSSFDGSSLSSSTHYVYALLRAENTETLAAGSSAETLGAAAALGVSVSRSLPFLVDAAPSPGRVQILPLQGEALKTSFPFGTNGWSDEDNTSLHFSFFVFPLGDGYTVSLGADGQLQSSPAFQPPEIDWNDATSARFWGKMDALMIRSFGTSPNVISKLSSGPSKASYAFFTVVRAKDASGAVAETTVLGPVVTPPADVSQEDLTNALAESQTSGDPSQVLASVQVVMSLSGQAEGSESVTTAALDALVSVTQMDSADDETLQQLGASVTQVVATGTTNAESLSKAGNILQSCLDLATTSEGGLSAAVGSSVLEGIAAIGETSSSLEAGEVKSVSAQMVSLISNLGAATLISLQTGATQEINSLDESGEGIKMAVSKPSTSEVATSGLQLNQLSIAAAAFSGRRLDSCKDLAVQVTEWLKSNPYSYAQSVQGSDGTVSSNADVFSVEVDFCKRSELTQPVTVTFPIPDFGTSSADSIPTCARFDEQLDTWVTSDVTTGIDASAGTVNCSSTKAVVSYTVFAEPTSSAKVESTTQAVSSDTSGLMAWGCAILFSISLFL